MVPQLRIPRLSLSSVLFSTLFVNQHLDEASDESSGKKSLIFPFSW